MVEHQNSFDHDNPRDFIDIYLRELLAKKDEQNASFSSLFSIYPVVFAS